MSSDVIVSFLISGVQINPCDFNGPSPIFICYLISFCINLRPIERDTSRTPITRPSLKLSRALLFSELICYFTNPPAF